MKILTALSTLTVILASAPAQTRVWTVDSQNRPGTDFTSLQTAFDQVPTGDRVRIRDGSYPTPLTLTRGLVVEAEVGVGFQSTPLIGALRVEGLPRGQRAVLRGLDLPLTNNFITRYGVQLVLLNCAGHVHLEAIRCGTALVATDSPWLSAIDCQFVGPVNLTRSGLQVNNCGFRGHDAVRGPFGAHLPSTPAIEASASTMAMCSCDVAGGHGGLNLPGSPAMALTDSGAGMTGITTVSVTPGSGTTPGTPTVAGTGGALVTDPLVNIVAASGGAVSAAIPRSTRAVPALTQSAPVVGQVMSGVLRGSAGDLFGLVLGVPAQPAFLAQFDGALALDLTTAVPIASGMLGGSGQTAWSLAVPNDAAIIGATFATQGIAGNPRLRLSNAAPATIRER